MFGANNSVNNNPVVSSSFSSNDIEIILIDNNITWDSFQMTVFYNNNVYTSSETYFPSGTGNNSITLDSSDLYNIFENTDDPLPLTLSQLYTAVSDSSARVILYFYDTNEGFYSFYLTTGTFSASQFNSAPFEDNISSSSVGKDCMEAGFNGSLNIRMRPFLDGFKYFYNTRDDVYNSTNLSDITQETNISIGKGTSIGTITINGTGVSSPSSITIIPNLLKEGYYDSNVVAVLPQKSGKIAVFEQSPNNDYGGCEYIALADNTKDRLSHIGTRPEGGVTQMLVGTSSGSSSYYGWMNIPDSNPISITYSSLKNLVDNNNLEPGKLYRITDYVTTTTQTDTKSMSDPNDQNHRFDLVVLATSTNTLDCQAKAVRHAGDTYFVNTDLSKWQIWYDINNDTTKYEWADDGDTVTVGPNQELRVYTIYEGAVSYDYLVYIGEMTYDNTEYHCWQKVESEDGINHIVRNIYILTDTLIAPGSISLQNTYIPQYLIDEHDQYTGPYPSDYELGQCTISQQSQLEGINPVSDFTFYSRNPGNGVIYKMIDEFGNDYPYDFKNIQFKRKLTNGVYDPTSGTDEWVYTFSIWSSNSIIDSSLSNTHHIYDNIQEVYRLRSNILSLNDNVFIGENCSYNTLGYNCHSNTFGNYYQSNTFGDNCYSNTFGDNCRSNTFRNNCHSSTFGDYCQYNNFGNQCYLNTFGDYCQSNTFGNDCQSNIFGNYCSSNTFGDYCQSNTFGNQCSFNILDYGCLNITFGNGSNQYGDDMHNIHIESGNIYVYIYQSLGTGDFQHIRIHSGTNTTNTPLTISGISRGNTYMTTVARNSSGNVVAWCEADNIIPI